MLSMRLSHAALIRSIALSELRMLQAINPEAAFRKAQRMGASPTDFVRGSLGLIVPWLATEVGADGPWVWGVGDAHQGNFATLAVGKMLSDGIVPVSFGIADVDDEGPSPWSWDLLRLLSSVAVVLPDLKRGQFSELCQVTLESYRECMRRFGLGDGLAARIDGNGLPEAVKSLVIAGAGEEPYARFIATRVSGRGTKARLHRDADCGDDPEGAACLLASWRRRQALPAHQVLDIGRRLSGGGLSSLGRRRWWILIRELRPVARLRLLEVKERAPSTLTRVLPVSPFTPWQRDGIAQPVCSTMGNDPFQRVLRAAAGEYLVRTRCHTRATLDLTTLDAGDRRRLGHLYGQLLATFHWRGLGQLMPEVNARCTEIATATAAWDTRMVKRATALAEHLTELAEAYREELKPRLTKTRLELG